MIFRLLSLAAVTLGVVAGNQLAGNQLELATGHEARLDHREAQLRLLCGPAFFILRMLPIEQLDFLDRLGCTCSGGLNYFFGGSIDFACTLNDLCGTVPFLNLANVTACIEGDASVGIFRSGGFFTFWQFGIMLDLNANLEEAVANLVEALDGALPAEFPDRDEFIGTFAELPGSVSVSLTREWQAPGLVSECSVAFGDIDCSCSACTDMEELPGVEIFCGGVLPVSEFLPINSTDIDSGCVGGSIFGPILEAVPFDE